MIPGLRQARVDQVVASLEHQLRRDVAIEGRYVHRAFRDFIGYVDLRLQEWRPVPVLNPGPDGSLGTGDDRVQ